VLPLEFIIAGPPVSLQTRNRSRLQAWKADVRRAATNVLAPGLLPTDDLVKIMITYYYDTSAPDVDNIIKPIQDALVALIYTDDCQVTDAISRKRNLNGYFQIRGMSPILAEGFCSGKEFLHITVDIAPDPRELN